jgi:hypothetical protein
MLHNSDRRYFLKSVIHSATALTILWLSMKAGRNMQRLDAEGLEAFPYTIAGWL